MSGEVGSNPPRRLLIADDHALVREGFRTMLTPETDLEVVGEAEDGQEALELSRKLCPDLVLMDVRMPKMDGLAATRAIKEECPQTSVLVVTTHESTEYLLDAIRAGAAGYVLKDATKQQLMGAIRRVLRGESPLNQELAMQLLRRLTEEEGAPPPELAPERLSKSLPGSLTPRELEVLRRLALGETNRQIAQGLHMSLSTVKVHVRHLISKLEVSDRTQAAVKAVELGLTAGQEEEQHRRLP